MNKILGFLLGPMDAWWRHRNLMMELTKRDVVGRYRGASFGLLWSLLTPFLMLVVYTLAFGFVFKSRWPGAGDNISDFSMLLFMGLIVYGFFSEAMTRSSGLIVSNPNFVKRIVFPLQILPWVMVLSALFHVAANILVFAILNFLLRGEFQLTILLLPLVFIPFAIGMLGIGWLLSSMSVFLRDIGLITGVLSSAMLFLSSAIVPIEAIPEKYRIIFHLNPLTFIINQARDLAFWGKGPNWMGLGLYLLMALLVAYFGYGVFQKTRKGFADVL